MLTISLFLFTVHGSLLRHPIIGYVVTEIKDIILDSIFYYSPNDFVFGLDEFDSAKNQK